MTKINTTVNKYKLQPSMVTTQTRLILQPYKSHVYAYKQTNKPRKTNKQTNRKTQQEQTTNKTTPAATYYSQLHQLGGSATRECPHKQAVGIVLGHLSAHAGEQLLEHPAPVLPGLLLLRGELRQPSTTEGAGQAGRPATHDPHVTICLVVV